LASGRDGPVIQQERQLSLGIRVAENSLVFARWGWLNPSAALAHSFSGRLGHASAAITLPVCGHLFAITDAKGAEIMEIVSKV
jgi:hypothetical protein